MKFLLILFFASLLFACTEQSDKINTSENNKEKSPEKQNSPKVGTPRLVIHGGAGTILRKNMSEEQQKEYENKLNEALIAGYAILNKDGTSGEAVVAAIQVLESSPLFNAGIGAVLTNDETISHDASFMDGATNQAGAVAGINKVKSPILTAYMVKENSKHVMLSGEGAHLFAEEQGLEIVSPDYFIIEKRLEQLRRVKDRNSASIDPYIKDQKMGTVGACALDKYGNLAAGTSTGGMTNKKYGRIGDSPIIGAGTYANNETCAVSSTGHGEFFIRNVVAYDIAARMKYLGEDLNTASKEVIFSLGEKNGTGGVITLDKEGNINMPFNTAGMFRGYISDTSGAVIKMFSGQ